MEEIMDIRNDNTVVHEAIIIHIYIKNNNNLSLSIRFTILTEINIKFFLKKMRPEFNEIKTKEHNISISEYFHGKCTRKQIFSELTEEL